MGLPRKGRRVKRKSYLRLYAVNSCTFFCCLQAGHRAHQEAVAIISYPRPKHPSSSSAQRLVHRFIARAGVSRPAPCLLLSPFLCHFSSWQEPPRLCLGRSDRSSPGQATCSVVHLPPRSHLQSQRAHFWTTAGLGLAGDPVKH